MSRKIDLAPEPSSTTDWPSRVPIEPGTTLLGTAAESFT